MIIYFHGFASKGGGPKEAMLRERFAGRVGVYGPTLPPHPKDVAAVVRDIMHQTHLYKPGVPNVFVGSSLGGFYAQYFASKWGCHAVLVNPATRPAKGLMGYLGTVKDYYGGQFEWTMDDIETLENMEYELARDPLPGPQTHLFVTANDDVIDMHETMRHIPNRAWCQVLPDGGHRQVDRFNEVVDYMDHVFFGERGYSPMVEPVFDKSGNLI